VDQSVRQGQRPEISFQQAWENLAFIQAAYESMERGSAVGVEPYVADPGTS